MHTQGHLSPDAKSSVLLVTSMTMNSVLNLEFYLDEEAILLMAQQQHTEQLWWSVTVRLFFSFQEVPETLSLSTVSYQV